MPPWGGTDPPADAGKVTRIIFRCTELFLQGTDLAAGALNGSSGTIREPLGITTVKALYVSARSGMSSGSIRSARTALDIPHDLS